MRAVLQRVRRASVSVDDRVVAQTAAGMLILLGVAKGDTESDARHLADKILNLRIFEDAAGKMNRSIQEVKGALLVVSQFTLYGDTRKGRRPGFDAAAPPDRARALYEFFVSELRASGLNVETGIFGERMQVELVNDGPVTFIVE